MEKNEIPSQQITATDLIQKEASRLRIFVPQSKKEAETFSSGEILISQITQYKGIPLDIKRAFASQLTANFGVNYFETNPDSPDYIQRQKLILLFEMCESEKLSEKEFKQMSKRFLKNVKFKEWKLADFFQDEERSKIYTYQNALKIDPSLKTFVCIDYNGKPFYCLLSDFNREEMKRYAPAVKMPLPAKETQDKPVFGNDWARKYLESEAENEKLINELKKANAKISRLQEKIANDI